MFHLSGSWVCTGLPKAQEDHSKAHHWMVKKGNIHWFRRKLLWQDQAYAQKHLVHSLCCYHGWPHFGGKHAVSSFGHIITTYKWQVLCFDLLLGMQHISYYTTCFWDPYHLTSFAMKYLNQLSALLYYFLSIYYCSMHAGMLLCHLWYSCVTWVYEREWGT